MSIEENIQTVVDTFQKGRKLAEQGLPIPELVDTLSQFEPRYRSVAFEGASVSVAIHYDAGWKNFRELSLKHDTQVHIGLGWAFAENDWPIMHEIHLVDDKFKSKVLDGYGYWHGLFRRRLTIRTQQIPENINSEYQSGFDQGVGRAIWYISNGDVNKVVTIINHFTGSRRADLWIGIGVASTYVGGCSDELMYELKVASENFSGNLKEGIEAAKESMRKAGL